MKSMVQCVLSPIISCSQQLSFLNMRNQTSCVATCRFGRGTGLSKIEENTYAFANEEKKKSDIGFFWHQKSYF